MKRIVALILGAVLFFNGFSVNAVGVSADSAVVMDGISGRVLYSVNKDKRLSMASTTKIMTALLLCEQNDLSRTVTVTEEMVRVEGSSMGLTVGIKVTFYDLLYGMLLSSGNDAANAAAIAIGGSVKSFVAMMNSKAEELNLKNTHFDTPSGLDGQSHYTTAHDLAVLTKEALKNNDFAVAAQTYTVTLSYGGAKHTLKNHNRLLAEYDGAVGVKTGFTKKSGRCLVSAAKRDDGLIIAVTLNDRNDWQDHKAMLDYGFSRLSQGVQRFPEQSCTVKVCCGKSDSITVKSSAVAFRTAENAVVTERKTIMPFVSAPVRVGEVLGYIEYYCGNELVAKQTLCCEKEVEALPQAGFFELLIINFEKMLKCI